MNAVFPKSIEELSELLTEASQKNQRVIPAGAATWLLPNANPNKDKLIISTRDMNKVIAYEPADLTAIVQAGVTLQQFNKLAAEHGQFIPLDPFGSNKSTLGAIVSTASYGPLRCTYGTPRDWLIGIRVVHADGKISKAGGNVVKNVAGYDLCKMYTGSFGSLAVIAEMSFKLRALPSSEKTLIFFSGNVHRLCDISNKIFESDLLPSACEMNYSQFTDSTIQLALRFMDETETVNAQVSNAVSIAVGFNHTILNKTESKKYWREYLKNEAHNNFNTELRLTCLPSELSKTIDDLIQTIPDAEWRAHAANGVVRAFVKDTDSNTIAKLRLTIENRGGQLIIHSAPNDIVEKLSVWGNIADAGANRLMAEIKKKFDPQSILPSS